MNHPPPPATIPPADLLARLEAIATSLQSYPGALGLIGLGSVGQERERLDAYSDLDFFVIVEAAQKDTMLANLAWLAQPAPITYAVRNTADGYKVLYADGIFCEFAVFTPDELRTAASSGAVLIWERPGTRLMLPAPVAPAEQPDVAWQLGEALTNLYVGLGRLQRGEQLSALRFIQHYAVDRVLALAAQVESRGPVTPDPFANERRIEQRYPGLAEQLPAFMQGYSRSAESALAILAYLEQHWEINPQLTALIRARAII
ncbi:MAG: hypothetical protein AB4911_15265 [Oscillochloridaceae bacterium umkhey_bin13]